jgi:flagellar motor switch/type III secretory pathway protein FliN
VVVTPFPWSALEAVTKSSCRKIAIARRAVLRRTTIARVEQVLGELTGASIELVVRSVDDGIGRGRELGACAALALSDDSTHIRLDVEPSLVARAMGHLLGRSAELERADAALDDALRGGFAALALEAVRRVTGVPVRLVSGHSPEASDALRVTATLLFEDQPYEVIASIRARWQPAEPPRLASLGLLPITLPVVAAVNVVPRQLLMELELGSAWLPGAGWSIHGDGTGTAALAAPRAERGVNVELVRDGSVVLRGDPVSLSWDAEGVMTEPKQDQPLSDAVLDAPVVVRVEVGSVTLTAREWAELGPGDVIETGRRVAEPVSLRVAGREVARGELVSIDGELGVRIRELMEARESR